MKNSVFSEYKSKIIGIVIGNIITNFPRGFFNGVIYFLILGLTIPSLSGDAVDFGKLNSYYIMYLVAFFVYILFSILSSINTFVQSYGISSDIRMKLGEKLRKLSLGFFKDNDPGDVTSRMLHDVSKAEETLSHYIIDYINGLIIPILIGIFLAFVNYKLSLILPVTIIISFAFFYIAKRIINVMGKKHLQVINQTSSRILEYTSSIKLLKSFNMVGESFNELDKSLLKLKKLSFKTEVWSGIPVQIALLILDFGYLIMLFYGAKMCVSGLLGIPEFFTYAILGFYFFEPVKQVGISVVLMRHAKNSLDRIDDILSKEESDYYKNQQLSDENSIEFKDVTFTYNDTPVLKNISCNFPQKSMTALVGISGAGKTTITSLIARFWEIQKGIITLGGINIKKIKPELLLSKISMVFQDVYLFNDTILNNIRVGDLKATDEEVIQAAKLAQCHNFISTLPKGYNTLVSEGGRSLSGGEKQRISIARAILKKADVILLDEATASLDPENENEIQLALDNLTKDKTIIVIAHKFSSIMNADNILVLNEGKIIESGKHTELIMKDGLYRKLWNLQKQSGSWKMVN